MLEVSAHALAHRYAHNNVRLFRFGLCAAMLLIVAVLTNAQTAPPPPIKPAATGATTNGTKPPAVKPDAKPPTSGETAPTRARRAAPESNSTTTHADKPNATLAPASEPVVAASVDELDQLREQIKATNDESERGRLQRELLAHLAMAKDKPAALDELRLMLHEDRFDPAFFYNLGNTFGQLGDNSTAVDAYRKAISQRRGHYARALNNLGVILLRQGRWDEAYDALAGALAEEHNTYAEASYNLGRLYLLRGDASLAIREWQHTLALQSNHADAAAALARAYAEDGDARRGLAVLDAFVARSTRMGGSAPLPVVYARREIVEASGDEATARARTPQVGAVVNHSAANSNGIGPRTASGRPNSLHALSVDPQTYDVLQRARAAREAGRQEEAVKYYRNVLAREGGYFPPANLELAFALVNLKRSDEAIASLEALVARDGARYPVAYYHLGRLYEETKQLARAADSFNRAATLFGDANPQVLIDLSRARDKLGDASGALAAMESYVKAMAAEGATPAWADEKLAQLRAKAAAPSVKTPAPPATSHQ